MRGINRKTASVIAIVVLIALFISGFTVKFYASFLFLFYSFTGSMVYSVILLGVFQTILLIPIRIINLRRASDIGEIRAEIEEYENREKQYSAFRGYIDSGNVSTLLYSVTFYLQLVSFLSIGRLFLTDFYSVYLSTDAIFSFVPYPEYPIQHTIYSFPYIAPTNFINYGWAVLALTWGLIIALKIFSSYAMRNLTEEFGEKKMNEVKINPIFQGVINVFRDNALILLIVSVVVILRFPVDWEVRTFVGDVTVPNTGLNAITATITFFTILWLNRVPIRQKLKSLAAAGVDKLTVDLERTFLWRGTLVNALLIALAAFFMTNQIPSAFELSVFTLETIALFSPFTLDLLIKKTSQKSK